VGSKWNRRARKSDATQPDIIADLEKAGVKVWPIGEPCDLLCYFWCQKHARWCWQPLEIKVTTGKKQPKPKLDKRQVEQAEFLKATGTKIITTVTEALLALSVH
jgi:hypothetical protein